MSLFFLNLIKITTMNELFKHVDVTGIIKPGENYYLMSDSEPDCIDHLYLISRDEDILRALEMEMCVVLAEAYTVLRFDRLVRISDACYEFRMLCYEVDYEKEVEFSMYLHRAVTFEEELEQVLKNFGVGERVV